MDKKKMIVITGVLSLFLCAPQCRASDDLPRRIFAARHPETWENEIFLFHPKPPSLRSFDYTGIKIKDRSGKNIHPSYEECSGKKVTVTGVNADKDEFIVTFEDREGNVYKARTTAWSVDGLIPVKDLKNARKYLSGKDFWYLQENVLAYNPKSEKYYPVYAKKNSRLKITGALPGWSTSLPVRLTVLTPHQEEGFVDINMSGTNVPAPVASEEMFHEHFISEDPEKWSQQTKNLLKKNMVKKGMSREQVLISWGSPVKVRGPGREQHEIWEYPYGDILIFKKGILDSIARK
jgi:hypothetical protein